MADRQIKLMWLIDSVSGGAGAVLLSLVNSLKSAEHYVVVNSRAPILNQGMESALRATGAKVAAAATDRNGIAYVQFLFTSFEPTIVVCHWWKRSLTEHLITSLQEIALNTKFLGVIHTDGVPSCSFDAYIAVSNSNAARLAANCNQLPAPIFVVQNGIELGRFNSKKRRFHRHYCTGTLGSLGPHKLPPDYHEIVASIQVDGHVHHLGGDGGHLEQFRRKVIAAGLEKRFNFWGEIEFQGDRLLEFYDSIDVYLFLPAEHEPFPIVVLEAMAMGLPVVALNRGGVAEQIAEGVSGFLCASTKEAIEKCELLGGSPKLLESMSEASLEQSRRFDSRRMIWRYQRLFEQILSSSAKGSLSP